MLPQLLEDVFPRHVEAVGSAAHTSPELLLVNFLVQEVAHITLHVADHHARPAWLHYRRFQPPDLVPKQKIRRVAPVVVVRQSHGYGAGVSSNDAASTTMAKKNAAVFA